jgi:hypothetical protein
LEGSGYPSDLTKFWELAQERGKADGATLANLLDIRPDPIGEPTADNLPDKLNPLRFILENILRNNLFIIKVRLASFAVGAPGVQLFRLLRDVIPPHTTYIIFIEISIGEEAVDLGSEGGDDEAGAEESASLLVTTDVIEEELEEVDVSIVGDPSYGDEVVLVRTVSTDCN